MLQLVLDLIVNVVVSMLARQRWQQPAQAADDLRWN